MKQWLGKNKPLYGQPTRREREEARTRMVDRVRQAFESYARDFINRPQPLRLSAAPAKPCFTPVRSPQSNGMSEAFVKTLKRDYVQVTPLPDAQTVLGLIGGWIEDYNENHPHSGLKMRSPRGFIATLNATA